MRRDRILRKWRSESDWAVKIRIATAPQIILRLGLVTVVTREDGEMVVDLSQPGGMRRLVDVFDAPIQLFTRGVSLTKEARKLCVNYAGDPVHDENVAARQLLCLVENSYRFINIAIAAQERQRRRMLGTQQADDAQVKRLLHRRQTAVEFLEAGREEFHSFTLPVGVHVCSHEQEQEHRVLRRCDAVYCFQVFKVREAPQVRMRFSAAALHGENC